MPFFGLIPWRSLAVLGVFLLGVWLGYRWHVGVAAKAQIEALAVAEQSRQAIQSMADQRAIGHAQQVRTLNQQLGAAHARISQLSQRDCLDPGTVGLLNAIGTTVPTPPSQSQDSAPAAPSYSGHGLNFSTARDLASQIAVCRTAHAELADQLNAILDIEDAKHSKPSN